MAGVRSADHWEAEAHHWAAWARTPHHDAYWYYRDAFFALVPPPGRATLEVGFGEGRVCRDLVSGGHRVTGVDVSPTLARLAAIADPTADYLLADGAALPFRAATFDLVVAYNSLMDVDDMPAVCAEIGRVLEPGHRLCICVQHPVWDAGKFDGPGPDAPFVLGPTYFGPRPLSETTFERNGLRMTFRGWCYSIDDYARALEAAGFVIEALREPRPGPDAPSTTRGRRLPIFLMMRLLKPA
jgi:SAM-dependent methyltransferase